MRLTKICLYLLIPVLISVIAFFYVRSFPASSIVLTANLSAPVTITRGDKGIPEIQADSLDDLVYGLGFVMAQDRLWQIDLMRRLAAGRLSELLGYKGLELDKFIRNIKVPLLISRDLKEVPDSTLSLLHSFSAGVNAGASAQWLPIEYYLTNSNWETFNYYDSMAIPYLQSLSVSGFWGYDVLRTQLAKIIGEDAFKLIPSDSSTLGPLAYIVKSDELPEQLRGVSTNEDSIPVNETIEFVNNFDPAWAGSNSWAISGNHTASGKPIIANDPHLSSSIPSIWYSAHLKTPKNFCACTFAAGTFVPAIGRTKKVAWGVTILGADDTDIYMEKITDNTYQYGDSILPLKEFTETINIKNDQPLTITFQESIHGPILKNTTIGARAFAGSLPLFSGESFALAWSPLQVTDKSITLFQSIMGAETLKEIRKGLEAVTLIRCSMIFGFDSGDIYMQTTGRLPFRSGSGAEVLAGWEPKNTWKGFIPYEEMPYVVNPPKGFIVCANNLPADEGYKHFKHLGTYFFFGRAERITQLIQEQIEERKKFTAMDQVKIQMDEFDVIAYDSAPVFLQKIKVGSAYEEQVKLIKNWNFVFSRDSVAAGIYAVWIQRISRNLLHGKVPDDLFKSYLKSKMMQVFIYKVFFNVTESIERLCDDPLTENVENCDDLITKSFIEACDITKGKPWGDLHELVPKHTPFSNVPIIKNLFERRIKVGGFTSTVHQMSNDWSKEDFGASYGPGTKLIVDLGNPDENYWSLETGISGNPFSPHYDDQVEEFHYGKPIKFRVY